MVDQLWFITRIREEEEDGLVDWIGFPALILLDLALCLLSTSVSSIFVVLLVHTFITMHLNYCNSVLAGALRSVTDKLQRVLNATACLVSGTRKFDRGLSRLLHVDLHWLYVPERVQYKLSVTVRQCQQHKAPQYLIHCVTSASDIASRQRLRCASRHQLLVPRYQLTHLVVGPSLSLDRRLGICCRLTSVIQCVVTSLSDIL